MQRYRLILLLAAFPVAAVIGGIVLGQWLSERAPVDQAAVAAAAGGPIEISRLPMASGSGVPEPPQPLPDGTRGVPPRMVSDGLVVKTVMASVVEQPPAGVIVSTQRPSAAAIAAASPSPYGDAPVPVVVPGTYSDIAPVNAVDDSGFIPDGPAPGTTVGMNSAAPAPARAQPISANPNMPAWQRVLRIALERCESQGSHQAVCVNEARENYCASNNGYGIVPECGR